MERKKLSRLGSASTRRPLSKNAEPALSLDNLRAILDRSPDAFWFLDGRTRFLYVNPAACRQLGYTQKEFLALTVSDIEARESARQVARHTASMRRRGGESFETWHHRKDGTEVPVEVTTNFIAGHAGEERIFAFVKDITERKRLESEHLRVLSLNEAVFKISTVGILLYRASGACVLANPVAEAILGATAEQLLTQNLHLLMPWKKYGIYESAVHTLDSGVPHLVETRGVTSFGRAFWAQVGLSRLILNGEKHLLVMVSDITEIKSTEERLRGSERKFLQIFTEAPLAFGVTRASDQKFLEVNDAWVATFGFSRGEALGKTSLELGIVRNSHVLRNLRDSADSGVANTEMVLYRKDGTSFAAQVTGTNMVLSGSECYLAMIMDVSERRKAEKALKTSYGELERKNIALQEVLSQVECEKIRLKNQLAAGLEKVLMPFLSRIKVFRNLRRYAVAAERSVQRLFSPTMQSDDEWRLRQLTPREREVCEMIRGGLSTKEMADILHVSSLTVHVYRRQIRKKLGLTNQGGSLVNHLR